MEAATTTKAASGQRLVLALRHPLRVELLRQFIERTASPNELAVELRKPLGTVSYHVRELEKAGAIKLVAEHARRGAIEHYYRGIVRATFTEEEWTALPPWCREEISVQVLQTLFGEAYAALDRGTFDSQPDRHLTWRSLVVDADGWKELMAVLMQAHEGVEAIANRSLDRSAGPAAMEVIVGLLGFERGHLTGPKNDEAPRPQ